MNETKQVTVAGLVAEQQRLLGIDDQTMAGFLELGNASVVKAIKNGNLRYPVNRVRELADLVECSPGEILRMILMETDRKLLDAIEVCLGPLQLTDAEVQIIAAIRQVAAGKALKAVTFNPDSIVTVVVKGG